MAGTTAGDDADLARDGRMARNDDARIAVAEPDHIGMRLDEALDRILDDLVRIVDKPLHGSSCFPRVRQWYSRHRPEDPRR
jgi:hypothetical protein